MTDKLDDAVIEKIKVAVVAKINRELLLDADVVVSDVVDWIRDDIWVSCRLFLETELLDSVDVKYPATWWEAFRERWWPGWLKRRYPIVYRHISMQARALDPNINAVLRDRGWKARIIVSDKSDVDVSVSDKES